MHLQHFSARLDDAHLEHDQQSINRFMEQVVVKQTATQFVPGTPDFWSILIFYEAQQGVPLNGDHPVEVVEKKPKTVVKVAPEPIDEEPLTGEQSQILAALKTWRKDKAHEADRPEYLIVQNATLESLARKKPRSTSELNAIKGLGEHKIAQFGEDIMAILNAF
jgi:superfamily II DNA helicase RecQ